MPKKKRSSLRSKIKKLEKKVRKMEDEIIALRHRPTPNPVIGPRPGQCGACARTPCVCRFKPRKNPFFGQLSPKRLKKVLEKN